MKRAHVIGLVLVAAAFALWRALDAVVAAIAAALPSVGFPFVSLFVRAALVLGAAAGLFLVRGLARAGLDRVLAWVDASEARLEKLPTARAKLGRALIIALIVGGPTAAVFELSGLGSYLETRAYDLFVRLQFPERSQVELATNLEKQSARKQDQVVVIALDDETISHLGWPLPRVHYAHLIDAVSEAKPASLVFDISLVDPNREHPEWDQAIGTSTSKANNVSFTFALARTSAETAELSSASLKVLDANSIPWHDSAESLPEYNELMGGDVAPLPIIDPVANAARSVAMANVMLDGADDVLRHSLVVARLKHRLLPSLSLRLAAQALDVPLDAIRVFPGSHIDLGGKRRIPIDALGRTLIRYQGRHDAHGAGPFRYVPLWSLLRFDSVLTLAGNPLGEDQRFVLDEQTKVTRDGVSVSIAEVGPELLKAGAVISGKAAYGTDPGRIVELTLTTNQAAPAEPDIELIDESTLRFTTTIGTIKNSRGDLSGLAGKQILVGSTALAAADMRNSPLGELPGVEHHATMLANIIQDDFFQTTPRWASVLLVLLAALIAAAFGVTISGEGGLLVTALLILASLTISFASFSAGRQVPIVSPPVALALTSLVCLVLGARSSRNARARAEKDREFVRSTFGRYLTEQVVQQLLDSPDGLKLGGKREFVTIMMTDLRGFTSMCGSMEPEGVVRLLNHYLEAMTRIITKYGGTIDEFIGDAILTVFGAPLPLEHTEARAVACAIEMLNAMPAVNEWNKANGLPEVEMGIGVHSGEVVLGNIGSELRAKYGIVGATINLTSRVESFTVGGQVLISEATRSRCADLLKCGQSQVVQPKGVKGTLTIHEALGVVEPFNVTLQSASANEQLVAPAVPVSLRFAPVKGKEVAELKYVAQVEAISEIGLELKVDTELATLTDLQLRVVDGDGLKPGDLYGKVIRANVRPNVVYLRLTSVPPELKSFLEAARGHAHAATAVPESALVST